jgi:hypothetical protein
VAIIDQKVLFAVMRDGLEFEVAQFRLHEGSRLGVRRWSFKVGRSTFNLYAQPR